MLIVMARCWYILYELDRQKKLLQDWLNTAPGHNNSAYLRTIFFRVPEARSIAKSALCNYRRVDDSIRSRMKPEGQSANAQYSSNSRFVPSASLGSQVFQHLGSPSLAQSVGTVADASSLLPKATFQQADEFYHLRVHKGRQRTHTIRHCLTRAGPHAKVVIESLRGASYVSRVRPWRHEDGCGIERERTGVRPEFLFPFVTPFMDLIYSQRLGVGQAYHFVSFVEFHFDPSQSRSPLF